MDDHLITLLFSNKEDEPFVCRSETTSTGYVSDNMSDYCDQYFEFLLEELQQIKQIDRSSDEIRKVMKSRTSQVELKLRKKAEQLDGKNLQKFDQVSFKFTHQI